MHLQTSRRDFLKTVGILSVTPALSFSSGSLASAQIGPRLQRLTEDIPNAEPRVHELVQNWITPTNQFYVRSHAPAPEIDRRTFRLSIEGLVNKPLELTLGKLKNSYERVFTVCTMTCAGNRRTELMAMKPIDGVPWGPGAIGNAEWSGFRLSDVLKTAGVKEGAKHVWFEGLDQIQRSSGVIPFGGSIPIKKAMTDEPNMPGAIVCDTMNGLPLTPDHGQPLRMVVPGFIGARSVKWVGKIVVSDKPSPNHYLENAYKVVEENTKEALAKADPIYEYALNSVIARPRHIEGEAKAGEHFINGYALPPGKPGVTIQKVEVSTNSGKTWVNARLTSRPRPYCWQFWSLKKQSLSANTTIIVRATDSEGNTQPETIPWNAKGYMMNQWHKVEVQ